MAESYLMPNEAMLLKEEGVRYDDGTLFGGNYTLVLTNVDLILLETTIWTGKVKNVIRFPLNTIKCYNGKPCILQDSYGGVEIQFTQGEGKFTFASRSKARKWVENIGNVINGEPVNSGSSAIPKLVEDSGLGDVADATKETIDSIKSMFTSSFSKNEKQETQIEHCTAKCASCGAPLHGIRGEVAICEYCGNKQKL